MIDILTAEYIWRRLLQVLIFMGLLILYAAIRALFMAVVGYVLIPYVILPIVEPLQNYTRPTRSSEWTRKHTSISNTNKDLSLQSIKELHQLLIKQLSHIADNVFTPINTDEIELLSLLCIYPEDDYKGVLKTTLPSKEDLNNMINQTNPEAARQFIIAAITYSKNYDKILKIFMENYKNKTSYDDQPYKDFCGNLKSSKLYPIFTEYKQQFVGFSTKDLPTYVNVVERFLIPLCDISHNTDKYIQHINDHQINPKPVNLVAQQLKSNTANKDHSFDEDSGLKITVR